MSTDKSDEILGEDVLAEGPVHEIKPGETYQIDSSDYDSEEERDNLGEDEYDALVDEGQLLEAE